MGVSGAPRRAVGLLAAGTVLGALALGTVALGVPPAAASGDPALDRYIISDPEAPQGYASAPAAATQSIVSSVSAGLSTITGEHVTAAAESWISPSGTSELAVFIVHFPQEVPQVAATVQSAASSFCGSGTASDGQDPYINGSAETTCKPGPGALAPSHAVVWVEGNVLVFAAGYGGAGSAMVESAAETQDEMIPPTGIVDDSSGLQDWQLAAIAGGGLVVLLVLIGLVRRPHRATLAEATRGRLSRVPAARAASSYRPGPPPGYSSYFPPESGAAPPPYRHPVPGDPAAAPSNGGYGYAPSQPYGQGAPEPYGQGAPESYGQSAPQPNGAYGYAPPSTPPGVSVARPASSYAPPRATAPGAGRPPAAQSSQAAASPTSPGAAAPMSPAPSRQRLSWASPPSPAGVSAAADQPAAEPVPGEPASWGSSPQAAAAPAVAAAAAVAPAATAPAVAAAAAVAPAAAAPAPPPADWYPINGNPCDIAYFDGTTWVAHRRWDGQSWVDVG